MSSSESKNERGQDGRVKGSRPQSVNGCIKVNELAQSVRLGDATVRGPL